jgi:hypothetical protein
MKLASLLFFALLLRAHQTSGFERPLNEPMCSFRDGEQALMGYALFGAIALIGVVYALALKRFGEPGEAVNAVGAGVLLLLIAATPAGLPLHRAGALVLIGSIFAHYALLLLPGRRWPLLLHLGMPIVLAVATGFQSYGLWQKGMICYLVVVAVVHHHQVKSRARTCGAAAVEVEQGHAHSAASALIPPLASPFKRGGIR